MLYKCFVFAGIIAGMPLISVTTDLPTAIRQIVSELQFQITGGGLSRAEGQGYPDPLPLLFVRMYFFKSHSPPKNNYCFQELSVLIDHLETKFTSRCLFDPTLICLSTLRYSLYTSQILKKSGSIKLGPDRFLSLKV